MELKILLRRIIVYVFDLFTGVSNRVHYWRISINKDISIHKSVHVSGKAKIDTFKGGTISIDSNTEILDGVLVITYGGDIKIGKDCSINPYTIVYGHGNTTIGNNVLIAGGCMIIPSNHIFSRTDIPISVQGKESQGIEISDDVWIGHGCSILDGVKIGEGSVIAAGSVVTQSVEAYSIMGGVPARLLKKRVKEK